MRQERVAEEDVKGEVPSGERQDAWSGATLTAALRSATNHFAAEAAAINALNVFPVPDGDTGTNMLLTLRSALSEVEHPAGPNPLGAGSILASAAHGALMGARGNSGVILYQILAGIAEAAGGAEALDGRLLAAGLVRGAELAYRAVVSPTEGTMLTVTRAAADAVSAPDSPAAIAQVLSAARSAAEAALARTPEQLDILRQAGVVDAGGRGVVVLLDGLCRFVEGASVEPGVGGARDAAAPAAVMMDFLDQIDRLHGETEFGYCTNFMITGRALPIEEVRARMLALGSSAVVVGDAATLKVHVHSDHPGRILEEALLFGELHEVRIDNMSAQTRRLVAEREAGKPSATIATEPAAGIAVVAVASGEGLSEVLRGMGATVVVPGGPSFNPSTAEIAQVVELLPHERVIILTNDANVVPAAQQVAGLTSREVGIVPSRSIPQGISALAAFNLDADLAHNVAAMTEALGMVRSLALVRASRDAEIDGVAARAGQFIGLLDGVMRAAGGDPVSVLLDLLAAAEPERAELVTLFAGEPAEPDLAERAAEAIRAAYSEIEVEIAPGGQPHYDLLVSVE